MTPASGSPSSSPPRQVAAPSASKGCRPASTSASTSQAMALARGEPPPKSVPAAMWTPAAWQACRLATPAASRRAIRSRPSSEVKRGMRVVVAKLRQERITVNVDTSAMPRWCISCAVPASISKPCSMASTPASAQTRVPSKRVAWAVTRTPRAWQASTARRTSSLDHGALSGSGPSR